MKKAFLESSLSFIQNYKDFSEHDIDKLRYGLEGIYLTIEKLVVIVAVSLLLGILKEVVITLVLFNIIRFTGFGFHAEKSIQCLFISLFQFVFVPYIFISLHISKYVMLAICGICIISYILFAPADTIKRPLPNKRKRTIRKWATVLTGIIYTLIIAFFNSFLTPLLLSSLIVEAIVINPLLYMAFNQPYNNYRNYVQA